MPPVPFPYIDDTIRSTWTFLSDTGVEAHCVLNFAAVAPVTGFLTPGMVDDVRLAVDGVVTSDIAGLMDANWQLTQIEFLATDQALQIPLVSSYAIAGTRAGDALPTQVACIASLRSAQGGRRGRGRNFWPFGTDADITDQLWNAGFQTAVASFIEDIATAVNGVSPAFDIAVVSHTYGSFGTLIAVVVDPVPDIQRRRRPSL